MKKIVKSLLFVAIVASMSMVGSCGGLTETSGDDPVTNPYQHLIGKRIAGVVIEHENFGLMSYNNSEDLPDSITNYYNISMLFPVDSMVFLSIDNDTTYRFKGWNTSPSGYQYTFIDQSPDTISIYPTLNIKYRKLVKVIY